MTYSINRISYFYLFDLIVNTYRKPMTLAGEMERQDSSYYLGYVKASITPIHLVTIQNYRNETLLRGSEQDLEPMIQLLISDGILQEGEYIIDGYWAANLTDAFLFSERRMQTLEQSDYYISDKRNIMSFKDLITKRDSAIVNGLVWTFHPDVKRWILS